ncbi:Rrf2 family transcriptional regulator [Paroceanicella profunda]|uniref:Rrf2 family transcriptional regulator n=1 Tax=Paroceanicella profunda TaxID=2579971 RepID=A0A5B8FGG7_9RHOB|nr:Rrf2 family transcriptional regulator [Paroceanicella profunda]QDL90848.1 Rrf2 family transcriptional regulator [Paroceanicella profunda]
MKLTAYSNFALRVLQFAALRAPGLVRAEDVAQAHGISRAHVTKVVHELGQAGYLETVRGRGGGFRLARAPETVVVGEVLRFTEGPFELVECFNDATNTCPLAGICRLSQALRAALEAFLAVLDGVTLADIAANRGALLERIAPRPALEMPAAGPEPEPERGPETGPETEPGTAPETGPRTGRGCPRGADAPVPEPERA